MKRNKISLEALSIQPFELISQLVKKMYVQKDNLNILSKYRCKVKNIKYRLILNDGYLMVKNKEFLRKISCKKIKKMRLIEKMWCFRVEFTYNKRKYHFDFKTLKEANDFLEHVIYHKVRAKGV